MIFQFSLLYNSFSAVQVAAEAEFDVLAKHRTYLVTLATFMLFPLENYLSNCFPLITKATLNIYSEIDDNNLQRS